MKSPRYCPCPGNCGHAQCCKNVYATYGIPNRKRASNNPGGICSGCLGGAGHIRGPAPKKAKVAAKAKVKAKAKPQGKRGAKAKAKTKHGEAQLHVLAHPPAPPPTNPPLAGAPWLPSQAVAGALQLLAAAAAKAQPMAASPAAPVPPGAAAPSAAAGAPPAPPLAAPAKSSAKAAAAKAKPAGSAQAAKAAPPPAAKAAPAPAAKAAPAKSAVPLADVPPVLQPLLTAGLQAKNGSNARAVVDASGLGLTVGDKFGLLNLTLAACAPGHLLAGLATEPTEYHEPRWKRWKRGETIEQIRRAQDCTVGTCCNSIARFARGSLTLPSDRRRVLAEMAAAIA